MHLNKVGCRYGIFPDGSESNQLRVCARKVGTLKSVYIASGNQSGKARALQSGREAGISVDRVRAGGRRMLEGNCQLYIRYISAFSCCHLHVQAPCACISVSCSRHQAFRSALLFCDSTPACQDEGAPYWSSLFVIKRVQPAKKTRSRSKKKAMHEDLESKDDRIPAE